MGTLTKDELIKLAELVGYGHPVYEKSGMLLDWQPNKDIKQAMECLEKFCNDWVLTPVGQSYNVYLPQADHNLEDVEMISNTLPKAICKAILKALEGD